VKRPITIHIAGQRYLVRSDADETYVQSLASAVDERVRVLKGARLVATQADVVLAALQLADELEHEKRKRRDLKQQIAQRSQRALDYLARLTADGSSG
jgi:cell division protein ZapA